MVLCIHYWSVNVWRKRNLRYCKASVSSLNVLKCLYMYTLNHWFHRFLTIPSSPRTTAAAKSPNTKYLTAIILLIVYLDPTREQNNTTFTPKKVHNPLTCVHFFKRRLTYVYNAREGNVLKRIRGQLYILHKFELYIIYMNWRFAKKSSMFLLSHIISSMYLTYVFVLFCWTCFSCINLVCFWTSLNNKTLLT